jgi:hypothetical protein
MNKSRICFIVAIFVGMTLFAACGMFSDSAYFNEDEALIVDAGDLDVYFYVETAEIVDAQSALEGS